MIDGISKYVWNAKYRYRHGETNYDFSIQDTWRRVAKAAAQAEEQDQEAWEQRFYAILEDFKFLPGGRILAGAGTAHDVTLMNCFVMGTIEDSIEGIFEALKEGALTMQQGGGVGYDFSSLRPRGLSAHRVGTIASGPVSFMKVWDRMCATLLATGNRRGAMMATLRCDHPDIEAFIEAKRNPAELRHFNLSVLVSDDFLRAAELGEPWPLVFPATAFAESNSADSVMRPWPGYGHNETVLCRIVKTVNAKQLWHKMLHAAYDVAEPGVLFIDRINRRNNLWYQEAITATNPCGEIPLPPYGACDLGSLNLTQFIRKPFSREASIDFDALAAVAATATRFLDNVIDTTHYPLAQQRTAAQYSRRIGLGITGLADALLMLGIRYGTDASIQLAADVMKTICYQAYQSSIALAREKRPFPGFDKGKYLTGEFVEKLPAELRNSIAADGIRNSHLTAIAPAGTISLLAGNISSGIEPIYSFEHDRRMREPGGGEKTLHLVDYAWQLWRQKHPNETPAPYCVEALEVKPEEQLRLEAAMQPYVDHAISKTINIPEQYSFDAFQSLYQKAYELGLKGCTVFRANPTTGSILRAKGEETRAEENKCCPH